MQFCVVYKDMQKQKYYMFTVFAEKEKNREKYKNLSNSSVLHSL